MSLKDSYNYILVLYKIVSLNKAQLDSGRKESLGFSVLSTA